MEINSEKYGGMCVCGHEHYMKTKLCVIESGALNNFEKYMEAVGAKGKRCAVYGTNSSAIEYLPKPFAEQTVIMNSEGLHADEKSTAILLDKMDDDVEVIIAVGSGTIHDICRYCAAQRKISFISVPTAASCDGFCSAVAAMTWYGYKSTMNAVAPTLVVADLDIISRAPIELTRSGIGDMLGKFIALSDWRIAHEVTGEEVCPVIYGIMEKALKDVWDNSLKVLNGNVTAYEQITYGLLMSGLAMQMLGSSRPASGAEHHISHLIETRPEALKVNSPAMHGEKVGVGTVLAAKEYHRLSETEDISEAVCEFNALDDKWLHKFFGERLYDMAKKENANDCLSKVCAEDIIKAWPEIRKIIDEIPQACEIYEKLAALGAKKDLADLEVPNEYESIIISASPVIRNRLTLMRIKRMIKI